MRRQTGIQTLFREGAVVRDYSWSNRTRGMGERFKITRIMPSDRTRGERSLWSLRYDKYELRRLNRDGTVVNRGRPRTRHGYELRGVR